MKKRILYFWGAVTAIASIFFGVYFYVDKFFAGVASVGFQKDH